MPCVYCVFVTLFMNYSENPEIFHQIVLKKCPARDEQGTSTGYFQKELYHFISRVKPVIS